MSNDAPWSRKMADTVLARQPVLPPAWSHEYGAMFQGMLEVWRLTSDDRYFDYVKCHIDTVVDNDGAIAGYAPDKYSLDDLVSGRILFSLYDRTGDERYKKAAATLRDQLRRHPRTNAGGFWHNGGLPNQMLLDGIYMGSVFYAEYARRGNDAVGLDDAVTQPLILVTRNRDAATGLFRHGWDEDKKQNWADPESGCSPSFWGRATGWYSMALVDLLDIVPLEHPRYAKLRETYRSLMEALVKVQDQKSGVWWHVLDQGGREGNYLEASASLMITYAVARGLARSHLQAEFYRTVADRAFAGVREQFIRDDNGLLTVMNVCKTAGLGVRAERDGSFAYYISEPVVENDLKGIAGFLLAAAAYEGL